MARLVAVVALPAFVLVGTLFVTEQRASTVWSPALTGWALVGLMASVGLGMAPLAALPLRTRHYGALAALVLVPLFILNLVHVVEYREMISLGAIDAIANTTWHEAREFVTSRAATVWIVLGLALVLGGGYAALVRSIPRDHRVSRAQRLACALGGVLAVASIVGLEGSPRVFPLSSVVNTYDYVKQRRAYASLTESRAGFTFDASPLDSTAAPQTIVLVIGESLRRSQLPQYGYERNTMPQTGKRQAIVFEDVVSAASQTQYSVKAMMTSAHAPEVVQHAERSLLALAREAGYVTYWLSNQDRTFDTEIALLADDADHTVYTNHSWSAGRRYDQALLAPLETALANPAPFKLIVLHLAGSHEMYSKRYPASHAHFSRVRATASPDRSAAEQAVVDQYDDSVRYTDYVLAGVLARLDQRREQWVTLFVSDHGEHLYDTPARLQGHGMPDLGVVEVEIPLLVWASQAFTDGRAEIWQALVGNRDMPVSSSDMFYGLADILGVSYPGMEPSRSFAQATYAPRDREVLTVNGTVVSYDYVRVVDGSVR